MNTEDKLFDTKMLAEYLGVAISTLRQYRLDGKGPAYIKIGHLVRYRKSDVEEWLSHTARCDWHSASRTLRIRKMSIENGRDIAELFHRVNNLMRIGKVAEVDYVSARARVQIGKNTTDFLPWLVPSTTTWFPLKNGEQVVVLSPNGDMGMAVILPAPYQSAKPAPSKDQEKIVIVADIEQTGSKTMTGTLHADKDISTASNINAEAKITAKGDITASGEVTGKSVALSTHSHQFQYVGAGQGATPQSGSTQKPS